MTYGRSRVNYLFSDTDISSVVTHRRSQISAEIAGLDKNRILNSSIEDLCSYIVEKFSLETPTLRIDEAEVDQREGEITIHDGFRYGREGPFTVIGTIVELSIPFSGDAALFKVRPDTFTSMTPYADLKSSSLVISISGRDMKQDQVKGDIDRQLSAINQYLDWQRKTTQGFNARIREEARTQIEARRSKLLADQNLVSGLGFAIKQREGMPRTYSAPIKRKIIEPRLPPASVKSYAPEPTLPDADYQNILEIINNMALVMERSPGAFEKINEEDLRQHFLVQLNGHYEGQASGETFNFGGKTDILIRVDGKNIFIAECKYWRGEKAFLAAIDQLLSYLSWRDTKAAIIIFNRNKNFSKVLEQIKSQLEVHPLLKSGPKIDKETRYRCVFGQKDDPSREVIVTVLAFDVPNATREDEGEPRVRLA